MDALRAQGHAVLDAAAVRQLARVSAIDLRTLSAEWQALEPDDYLRDGGRYRRRRHASAVVAQGQVTVQAARAHWQPLDYNALHGGIERWFAPITKAALATPALQALLSWLARVADAVHGPQPWYTEVHAFRIDTADGIGRPTPEGAHRDGVDLVAVFLVGREGVKGGETRVFEASGPSGLRFTLTEPWSLMLLDDARMIHESTPIQPLDEARHGARDTLVVTCRRQCFQGDEGKNTV